MLHMNEAQREFVTLTMQLQKRFCYYVSEMPNVGNRYEPCIVVENSPDKFMFDYSYPTFKEAKVEVDMSNKNIGLRESDVAEIIATSIAASIVRA